jgi:hypothetical protein
MDRSRAGGRRRRHISRRADLKFHSPSPADKSPARRRPHSALPSCDRPPARTRITACRAEFVDNFVQQTAKSAKLQRPPLLLYRACRRACRVERPAAGPRDVRAAASERCSRPAAPIGGGSALPAGTSTRQAAGKAAAPLCAPPTSPTKHTHRPAPVEAVHFMRCTGAHPPLSRTSYLVACAAAARVIVIIMIIIIINIVVVVVGVVWTAGRPAAGPPFVASLVNAPRRPCRPPIADDL